MQRPLSHAEGQGKERQLLSGTFPVECRKGGESSSVAG